MFFYTVKGVDLNQSVFSNSDIEAFKTTKKDKNIKVIKFGRTLNVEDKNQKTALVGEGFLKNIYGIENVEEVLGKEIKFTEL